MYPCCSMPCSILIIDLAYFLIWISFSRQFSATVQSTDDRDTHRGAFVISCKYDTNMFLYSKKYWCQGESRFTCEILADSNGGKRGRVLVVDLRQRGLFVKVTGLQLKDTGVYWVAIDKIYADLMTQVKVAITEGENKPFQLDVMLHVL